MIEDLSDVDLLFSAGSSRPVRGVGLSGLMIYSDEDLLRMQEDFDAVVAEMNRRQKARGYPYHIPKGKAQDD